LTVGREITLNGQISACDRLIVEGRVEADLANCNAVEVLEGGSFKGTAMVETALISGRFEGVLTVRGTLAIHRTGQVDGTVRYGSLEVQAGGAIDGDVKSLAGEGLSAPAPDARSFAGRTGTDRTGTDRAGTERANTDRASDAPVLRSVGED
jgi:cytoskeletal protein CcmA (bactofilin family)